jgi:hypothetical protein
VQELVRGDDMPAQWQRYPLVTQNEMMAGRMAIGEASFKRITLARWADEGERWLREHIPAKDLEYQTSWDVDKLEITLSVYRKGIMQNPVREDKCVFSVTEKANAFVSHLTVTKILLIS